MNLKFKEYQYRFKGKMHFYRKAYEGLRDVLIWLQKNNPVDQPNIVMPVLIPTELYRMVLEAGYEPKFFEIDKNLRFDIGRLAGLIDSNTQAVLGIHYFGIPTDIKDLKLISEQADVFLIEDCSYTINSRINGKELGTFGDIALFDVQNMLQLSDGGILVINNNRWDFEPSYKMPVNEINILLNLLRTRSKYLNSMFSRGYDLVYFSNLLKTAYVNFLEDHQIVIQQISRSAKDYIYSVDLDEIASKRRKNYQYLFSELAGMKKLYPIWPEPDDKSFSYLQSENSNSLNNFVPYSFPIICKTAFRTEIQLALSETGVRFGSGWFETPIELSGFDKTKMLAESLLELPVHQGLSEYQLEYLVELIHRFEKTDRIKLNKTPKNNFEIYTRSHNI